MLRSFMGCPRKFNCINGPIFVYKFLISSTSEASDRSYGILVFRNSISSLLWPNYIGQRFRSV